MYRYSCEENYLLKFLTWVSECCCVDLFCLVFGEQ